jgi:hypothetical protein
MFSHERPWWDATCHRMNHRDPWRNSGHPPGCENRAAEPCVLGCGLLSGSPKKDEPSCRAYALGAARPYSAERLTCSECRTRFTRPKASETVYLEHTRCPSLACEVIYYTLIFACVSTDTRDGGTTWGASEKAVHKGLRLVQSFAQ